MIISAFVYNGDFDEAFDLLFVFSGHSEELVYKGLGRWRSDYLHLGLLYECGGDYLFSFNHHTSSCILFRSSLAQIYPAH